MERRRLGRLGHESSVLIYGGAALAEVDQDTADASIQEALDAGINHFDVAAGYGDAELRFAPWADRFRGQVFVATKTDERDAEASWAQINRSLERLGTDRVDLLQIHSVGDLDTLDRVTAADGALKAVLRAQDEGLAGAVGITGHSHTAAATHLQALHRHPFATVLTPLNAALWQRPDYRADYQALIDHARADDVAVMTIKTVARRNWAPETHPTHSTWYEPYHDLEHIRAAVSWVLAHPEITGLATPGDVTLLRHVIDAEQHRIPAPDSEAFLTCDPDYTSPFTAMPPGI